MMIAHDQEIKVTLLGYVSVGKTTVLNAIAQDKYGEVSMRRTTAGVDFFHISSPSTQTKRKGDDEGEGGPRKVPRSEEPEEMEWVADTREPRSPVSTLAEITADNAVLREKNEIQEKTFDIELKDPLCEMRKDTKLVLVDIPGVNEAGSNKLYLDYVNDTWDTFDCVIVVLDAKHGANTDEQVNLLEQVKTNFSTKKEVKVIVLCNKVDDSDDEEMKVLVDEVRREVERIFGVSCRKEALKNALDAHNCQEEPDSSVWPAVIPISAENAFLYRTAYRLDLADFKQLDPLLIDKIGREEVGRLRWKKLSQDEKYEAAYSSVREDTQYKERLEATQFDKFLDILALTCGGDSVQQGMIQRQIDVIVKRHFSWERPMAQHLMSIYERCKAIGMPADTLRDAFWTEYAKLEQQAQLSFSSDMDITRLVDSIGQLCDYYYRFVKPVYESDEDVLNEEEALVVAAMERLVAHQFGVVCEMESKWDMMGCSMMATGWMPRLNWNFLSPQDWFTIMQSLLLLKHDKYFCQRFGREIVLMERLASSGKAAAILFTSTCPWYKYQGHNHSGSHMNYKNVAEKLSDYSRGTYHDGVFTPYNKTKYSLVAQLEMPKDLADPNHWGHLGWKLCEFVEKS